MSQPELRCSWIKQGGQSPPAVQPKDPRSGWANLSSWASGTEGAVGNFQTTPPDRCCEGRHVVGPSLFDVIARRIGSHPAVGSGHLSLLLSDYGSVVPSVFYQKNSSSRHTDECLKLLPLMGAAFIQGLRPRTEFSSSQPASASKRALSVCLHFAIARYCLMFIALLFKSRLIVNAYPSRSQVAMTGRWRESARQRIAQRQRERHRPEILNDRDELAMSPRPGYYPERYRDEHDRGQLEPPTSYYAETPQPYADELVLDDFGM
ncbi:hypothetical protein QBC45DRAFT_473790 [Copromyces sp. CBS 386.78]|nr:hypothetical protein QBC45DRAFT_473790 [Copromyces sp. CBS 386.78]